MMDISNIVKSFMQSGYDTTQVVKSNTVLITKDKIIYQFELVDENFEIVQGKLDVVQYDVNFIKQRLNENKGLMELLFEKPSETFNKFFSDKGRLDNIDKYASFKSFKPTISKVFSINPEFKVYRENLFWGEKLVLALNEFDGSENVAQIMNNAFSCYVDESLSIPQNFKDAVFLDKAFNFTKLKRIQIKLHDITSIPSSCFDHNMQLEDVVINGSSVTNLQNFSFNNCSTLFRDKLKRQNKLNIIDTDYPECLSIDSPNEINILISSMFCSSCDGILDALSKSQIKSIYNIEFTNNPSLKTELGISATPSMIVVKGGKVVETLIGEDDILKHLDIEKI